MGQEVEKREQVDGTLLHAVYDTFWRNTRDNIHAGHNLNRTAPISI